QCERQSIHPSDDLEEILESAPDLFQEELHDGRVHACFLVLEQPEHLDGAFGPTVQLQELPGRELVELGDDRWPRRISLSTQAAEDRTKRGLPELRGGLAVFVRRKRESEQLRMGIHVAPPMES